MLHINVASVIFGEAPDDGNLPDLSFTLPFNTLTLADLIARTVENQVNDLLERHERSERQIQAMLAKRFLAAAEIAQQAKSGKIALPSAARTSPFRLDVDAEIKRAITAFEQDKYKIFIDGREYDDLTASLTFEQAVKVKFMRIMPLAGG
ncbi:MAG: hypothetical protein ACRBC3_08920 [Burkholderiaceae bacterium]